MGRLPSRNRRVWDHPRSRRGLSRDPRRTAADGQPQERRKRFSELCTVTAVSLRIGSSNMLIRSQISSGLDPTAFPNPREIDLTRPEELYIQYGYGPHSCIGTPIAITALTAMLRVYGRLENIRRAPRLAGQMKSVTKHGFRTYMTEGWSEWSPFPTSKSSIRRAATSESNL